MSSKKQKGAACEANPKHIDDLSIDELLAAVHAHRQQSAEMRIIEVPR